MSNKYFVHSLVSLALIGAISQADAAVYQVKEVVPSADYRQSFAFDVNNAGTVVGSVRDSYNFPYYVTSYLTSDTGLFRSYCALSDQELTTGQFDASSSACLKIELSRTTTNSQTGRLGFGAYATYQKIGDYKSFVGTSDSSEIVNLFDYVDDELGDFTRSNIEQLRAINDNGIAVGYATAPYVKTSFQQPIVVDEETGLDTLGSLLTLWEQEFSSRAVAVVGGNVIELPSEETRYGGYSAALGISESNFVAGYEATTIYPQIVAEVNEDCLGEAIPLTVCTWNKIRSGAFFETRPVVWQLDNTGAIVDKKQFGLAFEPNENQVSAYSARALSVNDLGIAVGYGSIPYNDENTQARNFPLIFDNEMSTEMLSDYEDYDQGYAIAINNSNLVIGNLDTYFNQTYNSEFFIYDLDSEVLETPVTFYSTAQSTASGINDLGQVVGQAEYEVTTSQNRRKHGFIYDSRNKTFSDLNDLTECSSSYEIVQTSSINNNGVISATALKFVDRLDYLGEVVIDSTTGEPVQDQVAVSVTLEPIEGGAFEECPEEDEEDYERKGLSMPIGLTLLLSGFIAIRRRFL